MNFEEWWDSLYKGMHTKSVIYFAEQAYEAGIQEGFDRVYKLYDICPECKLPNGQHKMDCGRG
jgi:hypothetical protein